MLIDWKIRENLKSSPLPCTCVIFLWSKVKYVIPKRITTYYGKTNFLCLCKIQRWVQAKVGISGYIIQIHFSFPSLNLFFINSVFICLMQHRYEKIKVPLLLIPLVWLVTTNREGTRLHWELVSLSLLYIQCVPNSWHNLITVWFLDRCPVISHLVLCHNRRNLVRYNCQLIM